MRLIAAGTHKGWKSRNIKSYAERFFETVLNNNHISYERERYVGKYFLDFVIGDIDLEIDGKQHQYADRKQSDQVRDEYLRSQGYFVYRIKWNEINSVSGKEMMKDKIDLFLDFVDKFNV
jgi:very-short-patch-repair endonuclease